MRFASIATAALLLGTAACATAPERVPVTDVPEGEYVLVAPETGAYQAVRIGDGAWTARVDDETFSGQHWLDADGVLHTWYDEGPCAGTEALWTYDYSGNRLTMTLVEDRCTVRMDPLPDELVYERRW